MNDKSIGVVLPYWLDRPDREALDIARTAAQVGLDRLWIGEMATYDAFALAAAIGTANPGLPMTVGPLPLGVRSPVSLAMGVASVASLTGNRVDLALGASSPQIVQQWHGRDWSRNPGRAREVIGAVRTILAGGRSDTAGQYVQTSGFTVRQPQPEATIGLAAFGPQMTSVAAQVADEVVANLMSPAQVARMRCAVDRAADAAGRPRPRLSVWVTGSLNPGPATRAQIAGQLTVYLRPPGYGEMFTDLGFGDLVERARAGESRSTLARDVPIELAAAVGAIGDEDEIARRLDEYFGAGADHVGVVPPTVEDEAGRDTLAAVARHAQTLR